MICTVVIYSKSILSLLIGKQGYNDTMYHLCFLLENILCVCVCVCVCVCMCVCCNLHKYGSRLNAKKIVTICVRMGVNRRR